MHTNQLTCKYNLFNKTLSEIRISDWNLKWSCSNVAVPFTKGDHWISPVRSQTRREKRKRGEEKQEKQLTHTHNIRKTTSSYNAWSLAFSKVFFWCWLWAGLIQWKDRLRIVVACFCCLTCFVLKRLLLISQTNNRKYKHTKVQKVEFALPQSPVLFLNHPNACTNSEKEGTPHFRATF